MRAQLAETRRLSTEVVQALFHVVRLSGRIEADAFEAAARQLYGALSALMKREGAPFRILFTDDGMATGRTWASISPDSFECREVRQVLSELDADEVSFLGLPKLEEIELLANYVAGNSDELPSTVELSKAATPILGADTESLTKESRAVRAYVSAVLIIRHVFRQVGVGNFKTFAQINRAAELLMNEADNPSMEQLFLRSQSSGRSDPATLAVLTALLTLLSVRESIADRDMLRLATVCALLFDSGRARLNHPHGSHRGLRIADARPERLPASTAVVLIAMAGFGEKAVERTISAWEAQCSRRVRRLDAVYANKSPISNLSLLVATVRRYIECVQTDPATNRSRNPDEALGILAQESPGTREYWVLSLLAGYLGALPVGSCIELTTNWQGVVWDPGLYADTWKPRVRLIRDPFGRSVKPVKVDLGRATEDEEYYGDLKQVIYGDDRSLLKLRQKALASVDIVSQGERARKRADKVETEKADVDQEHLSLELFEALGREVPDESGPVSDVPESLSLTDYGPVAPLMGGLADTRDEQFEEAPQRAAPSAGATQLGVAARRLASVTPEAGVASTVPDLEEKQTQAMDKEQVNTLLGAFMPAKRAKEDATEDGARKPNLQEQATVVDPTPTPPGMPHLAQQILSTFAPKQSDTDSKETPEGFPAATPTPVEEDGETNDTDWPDTQSELEKVAQDVSEELAYMDKLDADIDIDIEVDVVETEPDKMKFAPPASPVLPEQTLLGTPNKPLRSNLDSLPTREVSGREARNLLHGFMPPGSGDTSFFGAKLKGGSTTIPKPDDPRDEGPEGRPTAKPETKTPAPKAEMGSGILRPVKSSARSSPRAEVKTVTRTKEAKASAAKKRAQKDLPGAAVLRRVKARKRR